MFEQLERESPSNPAVCSRLPELTDDDIESITNSAYIEYWKFSRAIRGQTITYADGIEFWVIKATLQWVSENTPTPTNTEASVDLDRLVRQSFPKYDV